MLIALQGRVMVRVGYALRVNQLLAARRAAVVLAVVLILAGVTAALARVVEDGAKLAIA